MYYQIVTEMLDALETIELYEDLVGMRSDSDVEDGDYVPPDHQQPSQPFVFEFDDCLPLNGPSTAPLTLNFQPLDAPACTPLGKPYFRQPNDMFHNLDPFMYYEARSHPDDEEYFHAVHLLKTYDEQMWNRYEYEDLKYEPLHLYILNKDFNIDFRIPKKAWIDIVKHFKDLQRLYESTINVENRIFDVQCQHDEFY